MPPLAITREQLEAATRTVYGDEQHAPNNVWIDHWDQDWSYLRATYETEFCGKCAKKLMVLRQLISDASGNTPNVTVVIYVGDVDSWLPDRRQAFVRNRIAGIKPRRP